MINPLRSEEDAFRFVLIFAALTVPIIVAAVIFGPGIGLGVAVGLLIGGIAFVLLYRSRGEPQPKMLLGQLLEGGERDRRRILVVANETVAGSALRREIGYRSRGYDADVRVVCPALTSKLRRWTSDEDEARAAAQQRLNHMVAQLLRGGAKAEGHVGDADPLQAMEDALRRFSADEVIISTHPHGRSNWLERDVVSRARERFELPVTHVIVDIAHEEGESAPTAQGGG